MPQQVFSVTQINEYIRKIVDDDQLLCNIAVKGEISNYKVYPSGHHYFTVKDDGAALKCVMFRGNATRLKFRPENGMKVIVMGRISVYPRDGAYQLYAVAIMPDGVGDLHAAFEQLKQKLSAQGLFDPAHKKPLPQFPNRIGIITSSAGAAIHDILRVLKKRFPLVKVYLIPVRVQGEEAPGEIAAAIQYANHYQLADLLIVGRGGGSIEDLWAFNDELVAKAIYMSQIPVISAVGHEPDVTISDFVADVRAATPSNAAELAVPDQEAISQYLDSVMSAMYTSVMRQLKGAKQHLDLLSARPVLVSPMQYVTQRKTALNYCTTKLQSAFSATLHGKRKHYLMLISKLDAMSPLKVLSRGYAVVQNSDREVVHSVKQLSVDDTVQITLEDGTVTATIETCEEHAYE